LLAGFLIGFVFANKVNRRELDGLRAEVSRARANSVQRPAATKTEEQATTAGAVGTLSGEEIRQAIASADARPGDIYLQRNLGQALYRYASQTQDAPYLPDVARLLKRAYDANPDDRQTTLMLAAVLFDVGRKSDPASFRQARLYYQKALEMQPRDVDARTELGLTYFLGQPSDPERAIAEYRKALAIEPRHELTLQNLASALLATGRRAEAEQVMNELEHVNSTNPALPALRSQLTQSGRPGRE
jgi:tetratricopeptide (TPR) repeat protein